MLGWSSIDTTRDTLTYGEDLGKTYSSILQKPQGAELRTELTSYTYDDADAASPTREAGSFQSQSVLTGFLQSETTARCCSERN